MFGGFASFVSHPTGGKTDRNFRAGVFRLHGAEPVEQGLDLAGVAFREQDQEFIASHARSNIGFSNRGGEAPRELLEYMIPRWMTVGIIDLFKAVKIEGNHGQRMAVSLGTIGFRGQALFRDAPVEKARQ